MASRKTRVRTWWAIAVVIVASGCEVPAYPGAQIQAPPPGFRVDNGATAPRRMMPDHEVVYHSAWVRPTATAFSAIYINGHQGLLTIDDVAAAQEEAQAAADAGSAFGDIERLTIDGRAAWGWMETQHVPELGIDWVAYRTVVAYDTISYAVEFHSSDPDIRAASPDTLRAVVSSFAVGRTEWNVRGMVGLLLLVVAGMHFLHLALSRPSSPRDFELAKVPGHQRGHHGADGGAAGSPILPGGAHAPGATKRTGASEDESLRPPDAPPDRVSDTPSTETSGR